MTSISRPRIAVLASGRGSNFESIVTATDEGRLDAEIACLISDRESNVAKLAADRGYPSFVIPKEKTDERADHEKKIAAKIEETGASFVVLAGYMKILTPWFIDRFRSDKGYSRIVNVHPSLLPAFPGLNSYQQAFDHGIRVTGVTVHLVDQGVDAGPICAQRSFDMSDCKAPEEVEQRGLKVEHELFPETLNWVVNEKFELRERSAPDGTRRYCVFQS